jgi:hypothetical protein
VRSTNGSVRSSPSIGVVIAWFIAPSFEAPNFAMQRFRSSFNDVGDRENRQGRSRPPSPTCGPRLFSLSTLVGNPTEQAVFFDEETSVLGLSPEWKKRVFHLEN